MHSTVQSAILSFSCDGFRPTLGGCGSNPSNEYLERTSSGTVLQALVRDSRIQWCCERRLPVRFGSLLDKRALSHWKTGVDGGGGPIRPDNTYPEVFTFHFLGRLCLRRWAV